MIDSAPFTPPARNQENSRAVMLLHTFTKDLNMGRTLYDKLWDAHLVDERDDGSALIYIDRHLIHEVTSPQAFEGLRLQNRLPRRLDANVAVPDLSLIHI